MNCDNFFEMLTSSRPLSSHGRQHIEDCPRCRDLQEAIFPAISQLQAEHPSLSNQVNSDIAVRAAHQLRTSNGQSLQRGKPSQWSYAVAFLTGVVASLGIAVALRSEPTMAAIQANSICIWQQRSSGIDPTVIGKKGTSEDVILSCLNCHLTNPNFGSL